MNPRALLLVAFATAFGALLGSWLFGLCVGLAIVALATFGPF